MKITAALLVLFAIAMPISAEAPPPAIAITAAPLGDRGEEVVSRITLTLPDAQIPEGIEAVVQGSVLHGGKVLRNFRYALRSATQRSLSFIIPLPAGVSDVDARLIVPRPDETPMILARSSAKITVAATGNPYVAAPDDGAEAILAEGIVPEASGAVRIKPPRRDLAPNLFIVEAEVKPPVRKVEFWADGVKKFTKNAPPYRAELDLGELPKRVEVRVIGYDARGNYIDADAWVVNERDAALEVKITRTETKDGVSHFKVSLQNPKQSEIGSVALFLGDRKLIAWQHPPYAFSIATAQLAEAGYVRASATDASGYEAADLLYLDGNRYMEQLEVNLVELPVSVFDAAGSSIVSLEKADFEVLEDGKLKTIATFGFSENLPLSLGVLVDHSGSMKDRIDQARTAAVDFFTQIMRPGDQAFYGSFAWEASDLTPFVSDGGSLKAQVLGTNTPEGGTALYDAIISGLYRFRSIEGRKALVIVTDGEDTVSRTSWDEMLNYVRAARVPVYFIGIGMSALDFTASGRVKSLAAETGATAFFVRNVEDLAQAYEGLQKDLRSQYLLGYYTESTKEDRKYRTVDVRVKRKDAKVRTIRGFLP